MLETLPLDFKTMIFMVIVLSLILSALLLFARTQAEGIHGIGHWALGNLVVSFGMVVILTQFEQAPWRMIPGTASIAFGIGLYLNGIQAFRERKPDYRIPVLMSVLVIGFDTYLLYFGQQIAATVAVNALVYCAGNLACAYMLLKPMQPPLRAACWFTGLMFLLMALLMALRAVGAMLADTVAFDAMSQWSINKLTFMLGSIVHLCKIFGFLLMLNSKMVERLHLLAAKDWLTGALNRRNLEDAAARMLANCERLDVRLSLLLIDLDHFKLVNDRYGHQFGDEVLRQFADVARDLIRAGDLFGRYGGEEFCVLLPNTTEAQAVILAERIRMKFAARAIKYRNKELRCRLSIGVCASETGLAFHEMVTRADIALYRAKAAGRNRVMAYSGLSDV